MSSSQANGLQSTWTNAVGIYKTNANYFYNAWTNATFDYIDSKTVGLGVYGLRSKAVLDRAIGYAKHSHAWSPDLGIGLTPAEFEMRSDTLILLDKIQQPMFVVLPDEVETLDNDIDSYIVQWTSVGETGEWCLELSTETNHQVQQEMACIIDSWLSSGNTIPHELKLDAIALVKILIGKSGNFTKRELEVMGHPLDPFKQGALKVEVDTLNELMDKRLNSFKTCEDTYKNIARHRRIVKELIEGTYKQDQEAV